MSLIILIFNHLTESETFSLVLLLIFIFAGILFKGITIKFLGFYLSTKTLKNKK